jgi:hypothetical protein
MSRQRWLSTHRRTLRLAVLQLLVSVVMSEYGLFRLTIVEAMENMVMII